MLDGKSKLFQNEDSKILSLWRCPVRIRNMAQALCSERVQANKLRTFCCRPKTYMSTNNAIKMEV